MHTLEQLRAGELCGARHLKLAENLTVFPPEIFSLKETLEVLDLTGNQLSRLPDELAVFSKLRIIFCSENRFTELPEVLGRCPALTMVGFKANRIATVPAASLPAGLRWLILTDNAIERLPDELGQCGALQKLMLSGNRLRELPVTLANCQLPASGAGAYRRQPARRAPGLAGEAAAPCLAGVCGQPLQRQAGTAAGPVRLGGRYPVGFT